MVGDRTVHHFGPDPEYVGGMGSVIRVLTKHQMGGGSVVSHPTWRPNSRLASLPLALREALHVLFSRRIDIVHVHIAEDGAFVREGAIVMLARLLRRATVVTIHGANFLPFAHKHRWLARCVLRRADVITCLDQDVYGLVGTIAPRSQVEVLPNPVTMDEGSPGARETEEIVLFAGEIGLRKGADVLCQAWKLVTEARPDARCFMVGPVSDFVVPDLDGLERRPPVDAVAMRVLLRSARVVALPSRAEGMPMVLTEAMGAGRPFVSTPVGGIPDLARQGGVLVPVDDHVGLAAALIDLLADPALAQSIGERGRRFCLETRSVEVIDAQLAELYAAASR
ncbi:MAG TPA: glycosyltransferase family 4 protein [Solirubrobacteraceae bacterium]|nr:glycosyltransferase family 4 protein [Solirubrobacteraceae bacterium]